MIKMFKSKLSLTLPFLLVLLLLISTGSPVPAAGADPVEKIKLGDEWLKSETPYLVQGAAAAEGELGVGRCTAFFDATNGILYLKDHNHADKPITVFDEGDLEIFISGENRCQAIEVLRGSLYLGGDGKLTLGSPNSKIRSSGPLTLAGGIIKLERLREWDSQANIGIEGSIVTITGDTVLDVAISGGHWCYAIDCSMGNNVIIAGNSRVTVDVRNAVIANGIHSPNDIHISTHGFLDITVYDSPATHVCNAMSVAPVIIENNYNIVGAYNERRLTYAFNGPSYHVTVEGGSGSGNYLIGNRVSLSADAPSEGQVFDKWTSSPAVSFSDPHAPVTGFFMPEHDVTVTAHYKERPRYEVTVVGGKYMSSPGTTFDEGETVIIQADEPPAGKVFGGWVSEDGVDFYSDTSPGTYFIMPGRDVKVTAVFLNQEATITQVNIYPWDPVVPRGGTVLLTGDVFGSFGYNPHGTWKLSGGGPGTSITEVGSGFGDLKGLITVAPDEPADTLTVTLTSVADPTQSASQTVTITDDSATRNIIVYGGTADMTQAAAGETVTVTAGAPPAGQQFHRWSSGEVTFADAGSETTTFVMPAKAVIITAEYSDIPVSITGVTVSPSEAQVVRGGSFNFTAAVSGTGLYLETVSWKVSGGSAGTAIDHEGRLTVAAGETAQTLTVTATSVADPGKSGTAAVNVSAVLYGDLNGDGMITVQDAILLLRSIVGLTELTPAQRAAADVDGSGAVNVADAVLILRYIVGLIGTFPAAT